MSDPQFCFVLFILFGKIWKKVYSRWVLKRVSRVTVNTPIFFAFSPYLVTGHRCFTLIVESRNMVAHSHNSKQIDILFTENYDDLKQFFIFLSFFFPPCYINTLKHRVVQNSTS